MPITSYRGARWRDADADPAPLQTETLFHTYSQFSTVANIPPKPTSEERETEARLEELFEKVR